MDSVVPLAARSSMTNCKGPLDKSPSDFASVTILNALRLGSIAPRSAARRISSSLQSGINYQYELQLQ